MCLYPQTGRCKEEINVDPIVTGAYEEIFYIVWNTTQNALIFDPDFDAHLIYPVLDKHELTVEAYICTHGHADHINALAEMHHRLPALIAMHSADLI